MRPVRFGSANFVYRGPTPEIGDLWVRRGDMDGSVRSVWEPTDAERKMIAEGGRIELAIFHELIPPVSVAAIPPGFCEPVGEHPFKVVRKPDGRPDQN
jgi:hypothetical protein